MLLNSFHENIHFWPRDGAIVSSPWISGFHKSWIGSLKNQLAFQRIGNRFHNKQQLFFCRYVWNPKESSLVFQAQGIPHWVFHVWIWRFVALQYSLIPDVFEWFDGWYMWLVLVNRNWQPDRCWSSRIMSKLIGFAFPLQVQLSMLIEPKLGAKEFNHFKACLSKRRLKPNNSCDSWVFILE